MPDKRNGDFWPTGGGIGQPGEGVLVGVTSLVKDKAQDLAFLAEDTLESTRQVNTANAWGDLTAFLSRYPFATLIAGLGIGLCLSRMFEGRARRPLGRWDFGPEARERNRQLLRAFPYAQV